MTTTTDRSDRLPALLDELALATPVAEDDEPFVALTTLSSGTADDHRPRRVLAAAAACLVVGGVASVAWAFTSQDQPGDPQPAPAAQAPDPATPDTPPSRLDPTLYPMIDEPPLGLPVTARSDAYPGGSLRTEALIGQRAGAVVSDTVTISVHADPIEISPMAGRPPVATEVFGQPAMSYDYGQIDRPPLTHVTWGTGPYFVASGADPLVFFEVASADSLDATVDTDGRPQLAIGSLPEGYEVIVEPAIVGLPMRGATLSIGLDNYDISVSANNYVTWMAEVAPLRQVDVAGRVGWMSDTDDPGITQDVAWQVDESTYAYLKVNDGTDAAGALELAQQITFVDYDTWVARYLPEQQDLPRPTAPATTDPG